jgi:hypothetical protein
MFNSLTRRPVLAALAVILAGLACAYADVPIVPAGGQVLATPVAFVPSDTPAATGTATSAPTDTAVPATAAPTTEVPPTAAPTDTAPPATLVVELTATETAAVTADATATATTTPEGPTAEPSATLDPNVPTPVLSAIPPEATFTRAFTATADGDFPYGLVRALSDGQITTWVSLRNGQGVWTFDLGAPASIAGVQLYAHRDRNQDTTLLAIEYSADGQTWQPLYTPTTSCGSTANCAVIPQDVNFDLPFGPVAARYFRLRSGPTAFALAEVQFAVMP